MNKKKFNIQSKRFIDDDAVNYLVDTDIEKLVKLHTSVIDTWILRDRKDFELGDISELSESIRQRGQAQPIIVVKKSNIFKTKSDPNAKYVVIAGHRRWLACKKANIKIDSIIRDMTFDQAIECLKSENERESISDYSNGLFYHSLKSTYKYTLDKLSTNLGISISQLHRLLSFAEVPNMIWDAVGDMSKVSSRTSAEILGI
jgi:ParB family chromosome partitioning protein